LQQRQAAATQEIISEKTATRAATTISQHANESSDQSNSIQILRKGNSNG